MSKKKKYIKLDFSSIEDEILIDKVRANPPLYAKKLKSFKDIQMKDNIWTRIAKEMVEMGYNRTAEECKKRWINLRDYYMKKKKKPTGSESNSEDYEKPNNLHFLDDISLAHRATISNISSTSNTQCNFSNDQGNQNGSQSDDCVDEEVEVENDTEEDDIREQELKEDSSTTASTITNQAKLIAQTEKINSSNRKRNRTQLLQEIKQGRSERMQLLREIASSGNTNSTPSSLEHVDIFFNSLAATTKTLDPWYIAEAKRKLFNVLADIEERNIQDRYAASRQLPFRFSSAASPSTHSQISTPSPPISNVSYYNQSGVPTLTSTNTPSTSTVQNIAPQLPMNPATSETNSCYSITNDQHTHESTSNLQNYISSFVPGAEPYGT